MILNNDLFLFFIMCVCALEYGYPQKPEEAPHCQIPRAALARCSQLASVGCETQTLDSATAARALTPRVISPAPALCFACLFYVFIFASVGFRHSLT